MVCCDTRYGLDTATGEVVTSPYEKTSFALADIHDIPEMDSGSVLFENVSGDGSVNSQSLLVTIFQENGSYVVGIDLDNDALVDVISLKKDGESPFVAMDLDNDGQVETSFVYNAEGETVESIKLEPMQPMTVYDQDEANPPLRPG